MSVDPDQLLHDASPDPAAVPDVEALWAAGRRRRRSRLVGSVVSSIAALAVAGAAAVALTSATTPVVEPTVDPDPVPPAEAEDEPDEGVADQEADDPGPDEPDPAPEPDPALMEDPCGPYEDHFDEFGMPVPGTPGETDPVVIDVVSPVDGQQVADVIELVGCSRVFEATVSYRLLGPDGEVLVDHFTTATAGGPMIGEFRETIPVEATGELTVEVFWADAADGADRDLVAITVQAG